MMPIVTPNEVNEWAVRRYFSIIIFCRVDFPSPPKSWIPNSKLGEFVPSGQFRDILQKSYDK